MRPALRTLTIAFLACLLFGVALGMPPSILAAEGEVISSAMNGFLPIAAELDDGRFVVVWAVPATTDSPGALYGRLLDPEGGPLGPIFSANVSPILALRDERSRLAVTPLAGDGFLVVWRYAERDPDGEIFGRRFSGAGVAETGEVRLSGDHEFQVNTDSRGDQRRPAAVRLDSGAVAVAWESVRSEGSTIVGRLFDPHLRPLTGDFPISETLSRPATPSISALSDGGFEVRWQSARKTRLRRFNRDGVAEGPARRALERYWSGSCSQELQTEPGRSLRVWQEDCERPSQILAALGTTIFADGFESGDTSAWSDRAPGLTLSFLSPSPGACLATNTPAISLSWMSPTGRDVDLGSLVVSVAGTPYAASCTSTASTIDCTLTDPLPEGAVTLRVDVDDDEGHPADPAIQSLTVDTLPPGAVLTARVTVTPDGGGSVSVAGGPGAAEVNAQVMVLNQTTSTSVIAVAKQDGSFLAILAAGTGDVLELTQTDCAGQTSGGALVTVPSESITLPPNPPSVAPPVDPTEPTDFFESTEFLYAGPNPVQSGVTPGTIDEDTVSVLRGRVLSNVGAPIPGVRITCHGHPEFGETLSRADGVFDLAVNGGGEVTVVYEKGGYLPAQRTYRAPWRDWAWAPDLVLAELDPMVTSVASGSGSMQVAQGPEVTDADGTRCPTLMVPGGTQAELTFPDGSAQPVSSVDLRFSEFTIGDEGPRAMPAALPPTSAYTYAVEISADEALAAGATSVTFSQPAYFHLENFLGFPIGEPVPAGYYDRAQAAWVGSEDGLVIELLSVNGQGLAEIDVDGSGQPADAATLAALGFSDDERQNLASLYSPGDELWRVPISHLTPWDLNWPYAPAPDAVPPPQDPFDETNEANDPEPTDPVDPTDPETPPDPDEERQEEDETDCTGGSIIECQNQILRESIALPGTGMALHYASDRVPGRVGGRRLRFRLSGDTVSSSLEEIEIEIQIGGERFSYRFPPLPNLTYDFVWNGEDAYARNPIGGQPVTVVKTYHYRAEYSRSRTDRERSWARLSSEEFTVSAPAPRQVARYTVTRESRTRLGIHPRVASRWNAQAVGLGGWTLSPHHTFDPRTETLYLGTGERRSAGSQMPRARRVAGTDVQGYSGDGGVATLATLNGPGGLAAAPDGSLYVADWSNHVVRRISSDGLISTFAGTGEACDDANTNPSLECGDGGPATLARLFLPGSVAIEHDGSVLIGEDGNGCIRRVTPDGVIDTVAGICRADASTAVSGPGLGGETFCENPPPVCEDCPADQSELCGGFAVAPEEGGGFLFSDYARHQLFRVTSDAQLQTFAGDPDASSLGDGGPAEFAQLFYPSGVAISQDGSVFVAQSVSHRVRRIGGDGIITTVAGTGSGIGPLGDGGPATAATVAYPGEVAVDVGGTLYISEVLAGRIRQVHPDSTISTVAGGGSRDPFAAEQPAAGVSLERASGVAIDPTRGLYFSDGTSAVFRIERDLSRRLAGENLIPSADGELAYFFNGKGRHLRTVDTLTGATIATFGYDGDGLLATITDGDGLITQIERDVVGLPQAVIGPYGHRTDLAVDANGWLDSVTTPAGFEHDLAHSPTGLLTSYTDPRDNASIYGYDSNGRLKTATNRAGTTKTLTRFGFDEDYRIQLETPLSLVTEYHVDNHPAGGQTRTQTPPSGHSLQTERTEDGRRITTRPGGTVVTKSQSGDPRFGMRAPVTSGVTADLPFGPMFSAQKARTVNLSNGEDPLSLASFTENLVLNARSMSRTFDVATSSWTVTSPEGRVLTIEVDAQRRPIDVAVPGTDPIRLTWDADGRIDEVRQGVGAEERVLDFQYDLKGRLETFTDPTGRQTTFVYDDDNRLEFQHLSGSRTVGFTYDDNGNLETLTPPGRPAHAFEYTADDRLYLIDPPDVGIADDITIFEYDDDRRLDLVTRPGGQAIDVQYDGVGRLDRLDFTGGWVKLAYSPQSGKLSGISRAIGPLAQFVGYQYTGDLLAQTDFTGVVSGLVHRKYDDDLRLKEESVNTQIGGVMYTYDDDKLLEWVGDLDVHRDPITGFETGTTLDQVTTSMDYNDFGELEELTASYGQTELLRIEYPVRDHLGRIVEKHETIQGGATDVYVYSYHPDTGFLESVEKSGAPLASYTYDDLGNRLSYSGPFGSIGSTTYDDQDRLLAYGGATFTYTDPGELLTRTENGQTASYDYDPLGSLLQVMPPGGPQIDYVVDGHGRRVAKKVNGTTVQRLLYRDLLNPVAEVSANQTVLSRFIYGTRTNVPDYMIAGGVTYRIISDHLGSPRLVINVATGAVAQRLDYDEYGRVVLDTNPGFQPFGFAGGIYDYQTGLLRFGAREYQPEFGRWTTKDPLGVRRIHVNAYSYAHGDPVNLMDLTGFMPKGWFKWLKPIGPALCEGYKSAEEVQDGWDEALDPAYDEDGQCLERKELWEKWEWLPEFCEQMELYAEDQLPDAPEESPGDDEPGWWEKMKESLSELSDKTKSKIEYLWDEITGDDESTPSEATDPE